MKSLGFWQKLQELDGGSNEAVSTIYLLGNSGCRKSEISRQVWQFFSARTRGSEDLTFVATVNAETLETIGDSYRFLSQNLRIAESNLTNVFTLVMKLACVADIQRGREDAIVFFIPEDLNAFEWQAADQSKEWIK